MQKSFFVKHEDFLTNKFDDDFFDAIATDPPWGLYKNIAPDFYAKIFLEFARILKPGGRLVLLIERDVKIPRDAKLLPKKKFDVLIHGKKATTYIFSKI